MLRSVVTGFLVLTLLLGMAFSAEAAEERLIAVILINGSSRYQAIHQAYEQNLKSKSAGNYRLYVQSPNPDIMSLRNSARKAVAIGADVIIAYGTAAALAAQAETRGTPVLFADVYDPASQKLVSEAGKTSHYATGIRGDGPIQTLLKVFLETTHAHKLAVLTDPQDPAGKLQTAAVAEKGRKMGVSVTPLAFSAASDLNGVLDQLPKGTDGLVLTDSSVLAPHLEAILAFATRNKLPVATQITGAAELGGFVVLENDPNEQGETLASMTTELLAGRPLEDLVLVRPRNVSLTINLRVAGQLGLVVPFEILSMTTRVIR